MGWLDELHDMALPAPAIATIDRPKAPRKPAPKPVRFFRTVRTPAGSDPGEVEVCYYVLNDNVVTLTNERGAPIAGRSHTLRETDVPVTIAHWLAGEKSREGNSEFNRRLLSPFCRSVHLNFVPQETERRPAAALGADHR